MNPKFALLEKKLRELRAENSELKNENESLTKKVQEIRKFNAREPSSKSFCNSE